MAIRNGLQVTRTRKSVAVIVMRVLYEWLVRAERKALVTHKSSKVDEVRPAVLTVRTNASSSEFIMEFGSMGKFKFKQI